MPVENEPLSETDVSRLARSVLADGTLRFSGHARQRLVEHEMSEIDVRNVLHGGRPEPGKYCSLEGGTWRYRIETPRMVVVIAFVDETTIVVVTVWRKKE